MNQISNYRQQINFVYRDTPKGRAVFACLCLYENTELVKIISVKFAGFIENPKNLNGQTTTNLLCGECLEQIFIEQPENEIEEVNFDTRSSFEHSLFARPPTFA